MKYALCMWAMFLLLRTSPAFTQCNINLLVTTDSLGNYTFTAVAGDSTVEYLWLLNADTLATDSNQVVVNLDSNGTYQLCLHARDTINACALDTCFTFTENNAEYIPLLDSINIWHMFDTGCPVKTGWDEINKHSCSCFMFYTEGDTIVDNIQYKILLSSWYYPWLQGFIREDTFGRKVYFRYYEDSTETLLYDFTMQTGDSLNIDFGGDYRSGYYRVDSLKTMLISAHERKVLFLNKAAGFGNPVIWIEGIGSLKSPIYPFSGDWGGCYNLQCPTVYNPEPNGYPSFVTCFEHADRVYFDTCGYENALDDFCLNVEDPCNYYNICGAIDEIASLSSFTVSPNPAHAAFHLALDVKQADNFTISILTLRGERLQEFDLGKVHAGIYSKEIAVSHLAAGIYLVECKAQGAALYRKLLVQD